MQHHPFGEAFMKNLRLRMGNCNHRRYVTRLVSLVASGNLDPTPLVTRWSEAENAVEAYRRFDRREAGWTKVVLGVSDDGAIAPGLGEAAGTGAATTTGSPGPTAAATRVVRE
ncbi:hypothetical protein ACFUIZ_33795 [Streptomyces cinereoruber]|uniref:hypothetical protein n=1 Tax=Streptomyces cinereoruber TaxID=67260 RepID=UPI003641D605